MNSTFRLCVLVVVLILFAALFGSLTVSKRIEIKKLIPSRPTTTTIPSTIPTSAPMADWPLYTSERLNSSFSYPPSFRVTENYNGGNEGIYVAFKENNRWLHIATSNEIRLYPLPSKLNTLAHGEQYMISNATSVERVNDETIGGNKTKAFHQNMWPDRTYLKILLVNVSGTQYIIETVYSYNQKTDFYNETFNRILNSLQFLDGNTDAHQWVTFTHPELQYSYQYPADWRSWGNSITNRDLGPGRGGNPSPDDISIRISYLYKTKPEKISYWKEHLLGLKTITIDGKTALQGKIYRGFAPQASGNPTDYDITTIILNGDGIWDISMVPSNSRLIKYYNKLLSTFKFPK